MIKIRLFCNPNQQEYLYKIIYQSVNNLTIPILPIYYSFDISISNYKKPELS